MKNNKNKYRPDDHDFYINKWFLDFTGNNGEAMIFYVAKLVWNGLSASYTSWLNYDPLSGVKVKSRYRNVHFPEKNDHTITWSDYGFKVSGIWKSRTQPVQSRIFDSEEGYLDWFCFQPVSKVKLKIKGKSIEGSGYAEQLIMTVPAWKIPMDELRWGRMVSDENNLVWIELRENERKKWLWINGEKEDNCVIEDDSISVPAKNLILELDKKAVLESEKKIFSVVQKIIRYIPGFNKIIPLQFIMADEYKWLSTGRLKIDGQLVSEGKAIHERVNFKTH
jgi:hypothetical protein